MRRSMPQDGGVVVLDVVLGIVPVIVAAATGAWYRLSPELSHVSLQRAGASADGPARIDVTINLREDQARAQVLIHSDSPGVTVGLRAR